MIFNHFQCSLLLSVDEGKDDGESLKSRSTWRKPSCAQLRVSSSAAFQPCYSRCSCRCSVALWLPVLLLSCSGSVDATSPHTSIFTARDILLLRLYRILSLFLVSHPSARAQHILLTPGNVTMEDTKNVQALGVSSARGAGEGLDIDSTKVIEEGPKESPQLESLKVTPIELAPATLLKQQPPDSGVQLKEDGRDNKEGSCVAVSNQQNISAEKKLVAVEVTVNSHELEEPVGAITSLPGEVDTGGTQDNLGSEFEEILLQDARLDVKQELDLDSSWASESLENGKHLDRSNQLDATCKAEKHMEGEGIQPIPETTLNGVLDKLSSLDPSEIFKDPVDDSFAPNYSKVIKTPMCFAMMYAKIAEHQYITWRSFVEDFERICYNAMKYNQKRSKIWNAASSLLRQGKKILEPYSEHGDNIVDGGNQDGYTQDLVTGILSEAYGEEMSCRLDEKRISRPTHSEVIEVPVGELLNSHGCEDGISPLLSGNKKDALAAVSDVRSSYLKQDFEKSDSIGRDPKHSRMSHLEEEVKVEILECTVPEDLRLDSRDEATECSSSFGYTQSQEHSDPEAEGLQQNAEVESELRDGNGALSSAFADEDEIVGGNERSKKALNAEWKKYRRGIEWRCRWLEVRLNELRARSEKYDRILEERRAKKQWTTDMHPGEESSARTSQLKDVPIKGQPILRRRRRKQVESSVDLDVYMARHPLFSRYGTAGKSKYKKRKRDKEDTYVETKTDSGQQGHSQLHLELERRVPEESDTEEQVAVVRSTVGGQDSMEQILWKIEALQARVEKMKHQLSRGAPPKVATQPVTVPKVPANLPRAPTQASPRISVPGTAPRPPGTKGRPPAGQSPGFSGTVSSANGGLQKQASASIRRRSSDYDINNMVMPVSVGAKYVEHIKHADIWTPHWRLVEGAESSDQYLGGSSSDEDTDDEQFESRHADMEINERQQRYMLPPKKSPDGEGPGSGKGRSSKSGMGKGAGKMSGKSGKSGRISGPSKAVAAETVESPDSSISPAFAGSIPKGKRRKRLFNAHAFTSNRAQKLTAQVAESPTSNQSTETPDESILGDDMVETKLLDETSVDILSSGDTETLNVQLANLAADQGETRKKRNTGSGLQVLANP
ncbi:protein MpBromo7 [Marchantia polymorpha subsp. ruderalis]